MLASRCATDGVGSSTRFMRRSGLLATTALMAAVVTNAAMAAGAAPQEGAGAAASQSGAAQAATKTFNIPAQPLQAAVTAFGQQSGLQVSYDAKLPAGLQSQGVSGAMAPQAALRRMLTGTGV